MDGIMNKIPDKIHFSELKTIRSADVVVVGGGPGGIGAAVMAARNGAHTLLIEQYGLPGGMASVGEVTPFMPNSLNGIPFDRPVFAEWKEKINAYLPETWHGVKIEKLSSLNPAAAALAAEELLLEAGVELLYHHTLTGTVVDKRRIRKLVLHSKNGFVAVEGKMFVDCTGDGDLAALSGCSFEYGNENGVCQPMTTCFKMSQVKIPRGSENVSAWNKEIQDAFKHARECGKVSSPRDTLLYFHHCENGVIHFNTTRVLGHDSLNGESLSDAEITARKQMREIMAFLREEIPAFKNSRLLSMGASIGIRESRRIKGLAYITREDFLRCAKFPDAIARCNYSVDLHSGTGSGTFGIRIKSGDYYEIPYGCIVSKDIDNLTVGGRPISVDVYIHASMRIMPCACSVGQAAGFAAAEAVKLAKPPCKLDGKKIRAGLAARGTFI